MKENKIISILFNVTTLKPLDIHIAKLSEILLFKDIGGKNEEEKYLFKVQLNSL